MSKTYTSRQAARSIERENRLAAMKDGRHLHGRGGAHSSAKDYQRKPKHAKGRFDY